MSQGASSLRSPDTSGPQIPALTKAMSSMCIAKSKKKTFAIFKNNYAENKYMSAFYRIQFNDVALVLGTYSQIARHRLCGRDAYRKRYALLTPSDIGLFTSIRRH